MNKTKAISLLFIFASVLSILLKASGAVSWSWFVALLPLMAWFAIPIIALVIYVCWPDK